MYEFTQNKDLFRIKSFFTAFTLNIGGSYFFAGERHIFWELVIVSEGEVGVTDGKSARVLKQGQAVLHTPMEFHRIWGSGKPGRVTIFSFDAEGLPWEAGGSFEGVDVAAADQLIRQTRECFHMNGIRVMELRGEMIDAQILQKQWELYLLHLVRQAKRMYGEVNSRTARNYALVVRVLESHICENLSVEQIAALCGMSPASVKQTFSQYAGIGVMNYFNRMKVELAVRMLRGGSSVEETAAQLGFSSPNYFSTVFKRIMGKSPRAYK